MYLRDMRHATCDMRAADLADDLDAAAKLLQHTSTKLAATHYRKKAAKLTAARWCKYEAPAISVCACLPSSK